MASVPRPLPSGAAAAPPREAWIERTFGRWLPGRRPVHGEHHLGHRTVYILPSRPGLLFGIVLVLMLIASINYALGLGYALTFLLAACGLVAMMHTFRNLAGLSLRVGRAEPVFAGELVEVALVARARDARDRHGLRVSAPQMAGPQSFDVPGGGEQIVRIALPTTRRGRMPLPRLRVETTFPLGLWQAWSPWRPATHALVWPAPESPAVPLPASSAGGGEGPAGEGDDDVAALRPWREGDGLRRIAWKAVARTGSDALLVKQMEGGHAGDLVLDWALLPATLDPEARIARLARWILDADAAGLRWSLRLPGVELERDAGPGHRARCLEALALWGEPRGTA